MKTTLERELKLESEGAVDLTGLGGAELDARTFTSTYYDTADRRLLRLGITLRRRLENGTNLWQLKLPREGARVELEEPGGPGGPPERLGALLVAVLRDDPLEEVAVLKTQRSGRLVTGRRGDGRRRRGARGRARVVDRFIEIEAELRRRRRRQRWRRSAAGSREAGLAPSDSAEQARACGRPGRGVTTVATRLDARAPARDARRAARRAAPPRPRRARRRRAGGRPRDARRRPAAPLGAPLRAGDARRGVGRRTPAGTRTGSRRRSAPCGTLDVMTEHLE